MPCTPAQCQQMIQGSGNTLIWHLIFLPTHIILVVKYFNSPHDFNLFHNINVFLQIMLVQAYFLIFYSTFIHTCNVFGSNLPPCPYNPSPDPLPLFLRYQLYVVSFLKDLFVCTCVSVHVCTDTHAQLSVGTCSCSCMWRPSLLCGIWTHALPVWISQPLIHLSRPRPIFKLFTFAVHSPGLFCRIIFSVGEGVCVVMHSCS